MTPGLRRLYTPRPAQVRLGAGGAPVEVDGLAVEAIREQWLVDDRWWTPRKLQRGYFELALADGRSLTVFRLGDTERWFRQRA